jgi:hypothetical protein
VPSILINSRSTTIKLTRDEVRAMQTTVGTLMAIAKHHEETEAANKAKNAADDIGALLVVLGEATLEWKGGAK